MREQIMQTLFQERKTCSFHYFSRIPLLSLSSIIAFKIGNLEIFSDFRKITSRFLPLHLSASFKSVFLGNTIKKVNMTIEKIKNNSIN